MLRKPISADSHILEPPGLYETRVPASLRDSAPRVMACPAGGEGWSYNGKPPKRGIGIEAMAAAQGIELKRPLKSSPLIEAQFAAIRARVAFLDRDRYLASDIETVRLWALHADDGTYPALLTAILPSRLGAHP